MDRKILQQTEQTLLRFEKIVDQQERKLKLKEAHQLMYEMHRFITIKIAKFRKESSSSQDQQIISAVEYFGENINHYIELKKKIISCFGTAEVYDQTVRDLEESKNYLAPRISAKYQNVDEARKLLCFAADNSVNILFQRGTLLLNCFLQFYSNLSVINNLFLSDE